MEIFGCGEREGIEELFVKENIVYLSMMIIVIKMVLDRVLKSDKVFY